jgi:hypothetical protein
MIPKSKYNAVEEASQSLYPAVKFYKHDMDWVRETSDVHSSLSGELSDLITYDFNKMLNEYRK